MPRSPAKSLTSGRPVPRIRIADASLRFYLAMERSARELSRSGRAAAAELINRRWASWRGRAVERPAFAGRFG